MIEGEINTAAILAVMKPGQSYEARQIAGKLGISTLEMRRIMAFAVQRGLIESIGVKRDLKYRLAQARKVAPPIKPMTISREMRAAQERCSELRIHPSRY